MSTLLSKPDYEARTAQSRDARMQAWRDARFGMFIHYGVHTVLGRNEWAMAIENWDIAEYEALAPQFTPKPGCTREWARLAKAAGMKYMVLTTRHHEGFSLWDSKTNPYNVVNSSGGFDVVKEFVESCREAGLMVGFYFSLMDWHHPDSWRCAFDPEARTRFQAFLRGMLRELLGGDYGKIDILWYDVPQPMDHHEGWGSLEMNQMVRELQPDIMINNRSRLPEDFSTPEEHISAAEAGRWEACMTFNRISWGYLDHKQVVPYSYNAHGILRMLHTVCKDGGNLLLNIGPAVDGSVPPEAVEPLETVGKWLERHGDAVYGALTPCSTAGASGTGVFTRKGNTLYFWQWIWTEELILAGFKTPLKRAVALPGGEELDFTQNERRIVIKPRPESLRDDVMNVTVVALQFDEPPEHVRCKAYPQLHDGQQLL